MSGSDVMGSAEIKDSQQPQPVAGIGGSDEITTSSRSGLPLVSLNHVSFVCIDVTESARFYEGVLGFQLIKRPSSFKFEGAWLFAYGIGIHLLEASSGGGGSEEQGSGDDSSRSSKVSSREKRPINPKDNHISFQCSDMGLVMRRLEALGIDYVTATVEEGGVIVDQLFFHDPDGYMVEICNCNNLPVMPLNSLPMPNCSTSCPIQNNSGSVTAKEPSQSQQLRCAEEARWTTLVPI